MRGLSRRSPRASLAYRKDRLLAGAQVGLDLQKLAIIAGALSVGIGFGLQSIAPNFVSGLILIWERGIRVGDGVMVAADQGFGRRIGARSPEIETFDRATLIVPNSNLVTGAVKNWDKTVTHAYLGHSPRSVPLKFSLLPLPTVVAAGRSRAG